MEIIITRPVVPVKHRKIDPNSSTVQGEEQSVSKLFQDYVLGRLDPRSIGGGSYDPEGSEDIDPFNTMGLTLEQVSEIKDAGQAAGAQIKRNKTVANAPADKQQAEQVKEEPTGGD